MTAAELAKVKAKFPVSEDVAMRSLLDTPPSKRIAKLNGLDTEPMAVNRRLGIRPGTDEAELNETEKSYLQWLRMQGNQWIGIQCIRLKLAEKLTYTPDFWALDEEGLRAIDVKASWDKGKTPHIEDDALVKVKISARLYPFVRFLAAWKDGEVWKHKEYNP